MLNSSNIIGNLFDFSEQDEHFRIERLPTDSWFNHFLIISPFEPHKWDTVKIREDRCYKYYKLTYIKILEKNRYEAYSRLEREECL